MTPSQPAGTTPAAKDAPERYGSREAGHCDHEDVCYRWRGEKGQLIGIPCPFPANCPDDTRSLPAQQQPDPVMQCREIIFNRTVYGKCPHNGDCAQCFLCDNAGGCIVKTDAEIRAIATQQPPTAPPADALNILEVLDIELQAIKSRIESSAMGQPLSERSRGEIIGLLYAREKIAELRQHPGGAKP